MKLASGTKITVTGDLGSGKSAVSKILCERSGFQYISTGQVQRQIAREYGVDTLELNRRADVDPSIDERIDGIFTALGQDSGSYVVDSRMAWFFLPHSFKVFLQADVHIAAQRILSDPLRNSEQYTSVEEAAEKILARKASENARFLVKYGADCGNLYNFDLVINTVPFTLDRVTDIILECLEKKQQGQEYQRVW